MATRKKQTILTPRPARKSAPAEAEPEEQDQWLDSIDPDRTRYTDLDHLVLFKLWPALEQVEEWLLHIPDFQRNIKTRKFKDYLEDMLHGYWINGVAEFGFDRNGFLIQGQHVGLAFREAKKQKPDLQILFKVSINRWKDAYLGCDLGAKRTLADQLKGETGQPAAVGTVLSVLRLWDKGTYDGKGYVNAREGSINMSGLHGREALAAYPGIEEHLFASPVATKGDVSTAAMRAASYRFKRIDSIMHGKFCEQFLRCENMRAGSPVLALRRRIEKMKKDERWRSGPTLAHMITAWNLFVAGEKCQILPFRIGQAFPKISAPLAVPESSRSSPRVH